MTQQGDSWRNRFFPLPLAAIIERNLVNQARPIQYFFIDIEGLYLQVLQSNDWNRFRPEMIVTECLNTRFETLHDDDVVRFLAEQQYKLFAKTGNSVFFTAETPVY